MLFFYEENILYIINLSKIPEVVLNLLTNLCIDKAWTYFQENYKRRNVGKTPLM